MLTIICSHGLFLTDMQQAAAPCRAQAKEMDMKRMKKGSRRIEKPSFEQRKAIGKNRKMTLREGCGPTPEMPERALQNARKWIFYPPRMGKDGPHPSTRG